MQKGLEFFVKRGMYFTTWAISLPLKKSSNRYLFFLNWCPGEDSKFQGRKATST